MPTKADKDPEKVRSDISVPLTAASSGIMVNNIGKRRGVPGERPHVPPLPLEVP